MKSIYKLYSKEEDEIIKKCVKDNINCLGDAFKKAESLLPGRTAGGIMARWYAVLKYQDKQFSLTNGKKTINNKKIVKSKETTISPAELNFVFFIRKASKFMSIEDIKTAIINNVKDNVEKDLK